MQWLTVKNWSDHQHYKDRNPPWIKLQRALLDDYEFSSLPDHAKGHLMLCWLFASQNEGRVPDDAKFLERKLGLNKPLDLGLLVAHGFLIYGAESEKREKWPSRYISDAVRAEVMARDGGKCTACGDKENLEIDHVVPVSKGGESVKENLQVLCRPCNRRKRTCVAPCYADTATDARLEREEKLQRTEASEGERPAPAKPGEKFQLPEDWQPPLGVSARLRMSSHTGDWQPENVGAFVAHHRAKQTWRTDGGWVDEFVKWMLREASFARPGKKPSAETIRDNAADAAKLIRGAA